MWQRLMLPLLMLLLVFSGVASAQTIQLGDYDMEWAILHTPVSSDQPDLQTGTSVVRVDVTTFAGGVCPPTSAYVVYNAPAFSIGGGATTTWCIKSDGTFDTSASGNGSGVWSQYTSSVAIINAENRRGNDDVMAVARQAPPPPPPGPIKVFITNPKDSATVSGTVWIVIWAEGTTGSSNIFTLKADGKEIGRQNAGSSKGPVTFPWNTQGAPSGTHGLEATVLDSSRATGSTNINVILNNP
jgi:hypothetical protein